MTVGTDATAALALAGGRPAAVPTRWGVITIGSITLQTGDNGEEIINVWPGPTTGDPPWRFTGLTDPDGRGGLAMVADAIAVRSRAANRRPRP